MRDTTRTFLAGLSVTLGVLSFVAMHQLANVLLHGAMFDQRIQYGGNAQIQPENARQGFNASDFAQIESWLIEDSLLITRQFQLDQRAICVHQQMRG